MLCVSQLLGSHYSSSVRRNHATEHVKRSCTGVNRRRAGPKSQLPEVDVMSTGTLSAAFREHDAFSPVVSRALRLRISAAGLAPPDLHIKHVGQVALPVHCRYC